MHITHRENQANHQCPSAGLIQVLLRAAPEAAKKKTNECETPLDLARFRTTRDHNEDDSPVLRRHDPLISLLKHHKSQKSQTCKKQIFDLTSCHLESIPRFPSSMPRTK